MSVTGTVQTVGNTFNAPTPTPPTDFYAVLYVPQNLSPSQKLQAIQNIGALTIADINALLNNVTYNNTTHVLEFSKVNGTVFSFDLSQNEGVEDIVFDANNDLLVTYKNGTSNILSITNLLSSFVLSVNGKFGQHITLDVTDIANLPAELAARVPLGRRVIIDGISQDLTADAVFTTNAVKYNPQSPTTAQQQIARDNIYVFSKDEVNNAISTAIAKTEALHKHTITSADVSSTIVSLTLLHTPNPNEWNFLYISSGAVSPESYSVTGNVLNIDTSTLDYPLVAGKLITFRYRY